MTVKLTVKYTNASFFLFCNLSLQTWNWPNTAGWCLTVWLATQHTAAATVRVGAFTGDGADLSTGMNPISYQFLTVDIYLRRLAYRFGTMGSGVV